MKCDYCGHCHTPDGCTGPPTPSDRWAGVSPSACDCDRWHSRHRSHCATNYSEGVGTGAGEGATGQDTGTAWVTRSADCPEAPAQAHPLGPDGFTRLAPESVENARRAEQAERRAEDAEAEVEKLRDSLRETLQQQPFRVAEANRLRAEDAEAAIEATRDLLDGWEHDGPDDYAVRLLVQRVRETLALGECFRTSREAER